MMRVILSMRCDLLGVQGFEALPEGYIFRRCEEICKETNVNSPPIIIAMS